SGIRVAWHFGKNSQAADNHYPAGSSRFKRQIRGRRKKVAPSITLKSASTLLDFFTNRTHVFAEY
ncbi:MAG: hypothetical protein PVI93_17845, partial [Desulfobacterales bacterium]